MLDMIVMSLAAWRLASMLVNEDGPWRVFARLRKRAGIYEITVASVGGEVQTAHVAPNSLAEGLLCVWCVSVWSALLLVIGTLMPYIGMYVMWFTRILAISAGAIVTHEIINRLREQN